MLRTPPTSGNNYARTRPVPVMYRPIQPPRSLVQRYADQVSFRRPANVQNNKPQMSGPGDTFYPNILCPHYAGTKKALCMGISYFGQADEFKGCVDDARNMLHFLCDFLHYRTEDIVILTDDNPQSRHRPTKQNIIQAMQWLVKDTRPNDSLFLHYSGHSGRSRSRDGDGPHRSAEAICPTDFRQNGYIVDDLMYDILVKSLPAGCRLTVVFDSCHSSPALGLPYVYYGGIKGVKVDKYAQAGRSSPADVIVWNVCTDLQAGANTPGAIQVTGAISSAFMAALRGKHDQSYEELLNNTREVLQGRASQL